MAEDEVFGHVATVGSAYVVQRLYDRKKLLAMAQNSRVALSCTVHGDDCSYDGVDLVEFPAASASLMCFCLGCFVPIDDLDARSIRTVNELKKLLKIKERV